MSKDLETVAWGAGGVIGAWFIKKFLGFFGHGIVDYAILKLEKKYNERDEKLKNEILAFLKTKDEKDQKIIDEIKKEMDELRTTVNEVNNSVKVYMTQTELVKVLSNKMDEFRKFKSKQIKTNKRLKNERKK